MNIIEAYEALEQGKRVCDSEKDEAIYRGDRMVWQHNNEPIPFIASLIDGWTIIDDAPKKAEFEDVELIKCLNCGQAFVYKDEHFSAHEAFRFSNFRGYLWRIKSGRVVCSSMPVLQNPNHEDSFVFQAYSGPDSENWPLAERFAVRFER